MIKIKKGFYSNYLHIKPIMNHTTAKQTVEYFLNGKPPMSYLIEE